MGRQPLSEVNVATLGDSGLVLITPSGRVLHGNATAAYLWEALQRTGDREAAVAAAARRYGVSTAQVRPGFDRMLAVLAAAGAEVEHL